MVIVYIGRVYSLYLRTYIYFFCQIFQALHLFRVQHLFQRLEYIILKFFLIRSLKVMNFNEFPLIFRDLEEHMTISGNDPSEKPLKTKSVVTDGTAAGGAVTRGTTPNVDRPKEQSPVSSG